MPAPNYGQETLQNRDFTKTANTGAGALQTVAEHVVPRGQGRVLLKRPGHLTFGAKDTFDGDGATVTFALSGNIIRNDRGFGVEPARVSPDAGATFLVYTSGAPGAGEFTIDFAANTVTLGAAPGAGADNVIVYYPFSGGKWSVEVFSSNERRHETFANGTIRALNIRPQDDVNSLFTLNNETPPIPQDYLVRIQVDSATIVNWDDENPFSLVDLPYYRMDLRGMPDEEIAALGHLIGA